MTTIPETIISMVRQVATALGPELLEQVAFVGGCTTVFFVTDDLAREEISYTEDVDLILDVMGYAKLARFQEKLRTVGFRESMEEGAICCMKLGELKVDFMPTKSDVLGFSNRWYQETLETAETISLGQDLSIKIPTPPLFIATKLEAYLGRGNSDPMGSKDIQDILNLFDGRDMLVEEIKHAASELRVYIAEQIQGLLNHPEFDYAIQSITRNSPGRDDIIYKRLEAVSEAIVNEL